MDKDAKTDALRRAVLDAALRNAAFDGWTETALVKAAEDAGVGRAAAKRIFPDGIAELLDFHLQEADRAMLEAMKRGLTPRMRVPARIAFAVRARLDRAAPHREAIRRALVAFAHPRNARVAARGLARTTDAIWRGIGDRSTDFSYYTKRATLAPIYAATLLYWLDDESEGSAETWAFLDRRLNAVARFGAAKKRASGALDALRAGAPFLARMLRRAA